MASGTAPITIWCSRVESLILSHHLGFSVTCECNEEEINDDDDVRELGGVRNGLGKVSAPSCLRAAAQTVVAVQGGADLVFALIAAVRQLARIHFRHLGVTS